jgi:hypothetical protein
MKVSRRNFGVAGPAAAAVTLALSAFPVQEALAAAAVTGQWEQVRVKLSSLTTRSAAF